MAVAQTAFTERQAMPCIFILPSTYLKEFALCYERHPESVRTVPWLRAAGRDSIPALPSLPSLPLSEFQFDSLYSVRLPKKSIKFREKI